MDSICTFNATVNKLVYKGMNDFKIYAMDIDKKKYPDIQLNKYGNVSIAGEMIDLDYDVEYSIAATEDDSKYGTTYRVKKISREYPTNTIDIYNFLRTVLTESQADVLYRVYPDIIDRILNNKSVDLERLKGIKEKTFDKIKKKVLDNYAMMSVVNKFDGLLSLNVIEKLYEKYTSVELIEKSLKEDPYRALCEISRIGFLKADNIIQNMETQSNKMIQDGKNPVIVFDEPIIKSKQRCLFSIIHILEDNEMCGSTYINYISLKNNISAIANECMDKFEDAINDDRIYYDVEKDIVALKTTYNTEQYIAETLINAMKNENVFSIDNIDSYKNIDETNNRVLTKEQFCILQLLCKFNVGILNGSAGTGKSQTISSVIRMLNDNHLSYMLMTPTGKSAKVLKDYTKYEATTIHRGLGYNPLSGFFYNSNNKLLCDVVIIDEISMVDIFLFKRLLEAIDFNHTKLLMVGDNAQLPSVGCGNILFDLMESKKIPVITLNKVFRYADGGLMKVATDIRYSKKYLENKSIQQFGDDYIYIDINPNNQYDCINKLIQIYDKLLQSNISPSKIQVLSAQKVGEYGSRVINNQLQMLANSNYGSNNNIQVGETKFYEGDIVIQTVNNYKAEIYNEDNIFNDDAEYTFIANGETGVIKKIEKDYVVIEFDNADVMYKKSDMNKIDLGYCITVHKSQGSSAEYVIFISPKAHTFMLNSNLMYVAVTRTVKKCFHIGMRQTIDFCIKKKEDFNRKTLLKDFLLSI